LASVFIRNSEPALLKATVVPYGIYRLKNAANLPIGFNRDDIVLIAHSWSRDCNNRKMISLKNPATVSPRLVTYDDVGRLEAINGEVVIQQ
jgi:hypothetical protein